MSSEPRDDSKELRENPPGPLDADCELIPPVRAHQHQRALDAVLPGQCPSNSSAPCTKGDLTCRLRDQ